MVNVSPVVIAVATVIGTIAGSAVSVVVLRVLHDAATVAFEARLFAYLAVVFDEAGLPVPTLPPNVGVVMVRRANPKPPDETSSKGSTLEEPPQTTAQP